MESSSSALRTSDRPIADVHRRIRRHDRRSRSNGPDLMITGAITKVTLSRTTEPSPTDFTALPGVEQCGVLDRRRPPQSRLSTAAPLFREGRPPAHRGLTEAATVRADRRRSLHCSRDAGRALSEDHGPRLRRFVAFAMPGDAMDLVLVPWGKVRHRCTAEHCVGHRRGHRRNLDPLLLTS